MKTPTKDFNTVDGKIRSVQVIAAALILGIVGALLVVIATLGLGKFVAPDILAIFILVFGAITIGLSFVVPNFIGQSNAQKARDSHDKGSEKLFDAVAGAYMNKKIVQFALIEGSVFASILFFFINQNSLLLVYAVFALVVLLLGFPKRQEAQEWIDTHATN